MIVYPSYLSIRKKPKNIKPEDELLFKSALKVEIPDTKCFIVKRSSILKDHIFQPGRFTFYTSYSHITKVSLFKQARKLYLYLFPYNKLLKGAWIIDEWSQEYFHWLTDALSRLLVIEEVYGKVPIILPGRFRHVSYIQQSLEFLGWTPVFYDMNRRLFVENLFMISHTAPTGNYNKEIINKLRGRFNLPGSKGGNKNVYISRHKAEKRKVINESELITFLSQEEFEICYLEDLLFLEQIALLSTTKCLIGLHGAGLSNMIFMTSSGIIVELRNFNDTHNNCYFALASDLDHDYHYLRCHSDGDNPNSANVYVDIALLKELLKNLSI